MKANPAAAALALAILMPLAAACDAGAAEPQSTAREARAIDAASGLPGMDAPSVAELAQPADLVVSGQVFAADGTTPAPGVVLYVYQTGKNGRYAERAGAPPTLRAWLRTDAEGRYEYRTIRPGAYPQGNVAAHIHTQLWGEDVPPQWGTDLLFADDPRVSEDERQRSARLGRFAFVCTPEAAADGVARCRHDLRLKTAGDRFEAVTRHGLEGGG